MKILSVIVLLAAMLGQTFSKCLVVLDYQCNKAYISKMLCVNRNRPEMKCEGKCYLCKKLKADAKKDQQDPERKTESPSELISYWATVELAAPTTLTVLSQYPVFQERPLTRGTGAPFIPPRA